MKYHIYTDGATNPEIYKVSIAYMIHTDETFVHMDTATFNSRFISVAETLAIGVAAQYMLVKIKPTKEDEVIFYTDATAAKKYIMDYMAGIERPTTDERIKAVLKTMKILSEVSNFSIKKVKAHTQDISGNNIVDQLAKLSLAGNRKGLQ